MFERIGDMMQLRQKLVGYVDAPVLDKRAQAAPTNTKGKHAAPTKAKCAARKIKLKPWGQPNFRGRVLRPKMEPIERTSVLPREIFGRFVSESFWMDPNNNVSQVPIV
jgi:hypothetical protein